MTQPDAEATVRPPRLRWRHLGYVGTAVSILVVILAGGLFWYASTPQFAARVHAKLVATLERATGGRVEIRSFQCSVPRLAIQVDGLTIHGTEAPGQAPYFHVDHLTLDAKIISFFTPKIALSSLEAERPTLHLIFNPDGTTNQPQPRTASKQPLPEVLLNLAIDSTRVQDGLVQLNNRKIPWEMAAGPLQATMRYMGSSAEYRAEVETNNITFRLKNATEAHSQLKASISLGKDKVAVENLDLKTGQSHLTMNGQLQNFSDPSWQMGIHGAVDAREIGAMTGEDELRNGAAQLNIQAHGEPGQTASEDFQVTGHVDMRAGEWESSWLRLRNVELHTNLIVDNDQCSLTGFSSLLDDGGRISGSLVMRHCVGPSAPVVLPAVARTGSGGSKLSGSKISVSKRVQLSTRELLNRLHRKRKVVAPKLGAPVYQPLEADMEAQVSGVTLPLILAATAPRQYWNIGFTTATYGQVTARWSGEGNGLDVHGNLTMRAPRRLLGLIPVTGSAHADYLGDHHHLVIEQADEDTPATQVHASGLLTLYTRDLKSALHLDVAGHDLGEFDRLLTVLDLRATPKGEANDLPLKLLGTTRFHGDIDGSFFALEAVGHLDSERFEMVLAKSPPPDHPNAPLAFHLLKWDGFHTDLSYTPSQLDVRNAELLRGHTTIHTSFDLLPHRTGRDDYKYDKQTHISGTMQTNNASIADLQSVLGSGYPASGELTANAHVSGIVDDLAGAGHVTLTDGVVNGEKIPEASIHLAAQGHTFEATHMQMVAASGTAAGNLTYDYETGALQGQLTGQNFKLEQVAVLQTQRIAVGGTLGFHVQAAGTTSSPIATGAVQIENLTLDHQPMGRLHAEAHLQDANLTLTSRAELLDTHLDAAGHVQLSGNDPAQAQLTFVGFNIEPMLQILTPATLTGTSSLDGRITMSGPLKQFAAIRADADLKTFTATINHRPIRSNGPVQVLLRDGKVELKQVRLASEDMDLLASGTVDLLNNYRLRLNAEGSIDAGLASILYPNVQSSGQLRFVVNARGTAQQPDLRGTAQITHVNLHMLNVTNGLTDLNGQMLFDQDRLVVQQLTGSSGGGALQVKGFVGYRNGIFVDLTATTKDVRVRYPKGISTSVDSKLRLLGTYDSLLLSGNVEMVRFGIGSTVDLASLAGGGGVSAPIDPSSPLNRVRLDVHVTSAPELGFQNSFASLAGEVNLRIRGTLENPSVLGRVDISQGSASFAGTTYRLQQGDIVFANPVTISPQIDLEASARVQNYDIIITLHGPPSKLDISYRSEPPLTQADVLALLALGRTNEQATQYGEQQQAGANLTSEALLGGALNAAVSSRVQKLFGVGSVRVDPNFVGTLGESTARVTVEEQVGPKLTLTFATNVNTTEQQLIQGQFDLTRNVSIIAVRDESDVFSMYLQIRAKHE